MMIPPRISETEPNVWEAKGTFPKDKTLALIQVLLDTVEAYPETWFRFNLKVTGIRPKLKQQPLNVSVQKDEAEK